MVIVHKMALYVVHQPQSTHAQGTITINVVHQPQSTLL
jgi:hypothetical protein